jgi:hypothetical protein
MGNCSKITTLYIIIAAIMMLISGCKSGIIENSNSTDRFPVIEPDYINVTIPPNIAPMNFIIKEEASSFRVIVSSGKSDKKTEIRTSDGTVKFPAKAWEKLLRESMGDRIEVQVFTSVKGEDNYRKYDTFFMSVSEDKIDPYLAYRLIHPGYYSWSNIRIMQRSLESFREESVIENRIMEKNCANCHSFNNNRADRFMVHIRGSLGGTYFVEDGNITRTDPKIDEMPGGATYPSWHPGGRFLAFSSNQVRQSFYSVSEKSIEVFDLVSSLILYDRQNNEIISITDRDTTEYLQTFPSWSPDGKYLYFCRALKVINSDDPELEQILNTHYDLARKSFDPDKRTFGETEIVFDASGINKSASFPRVSPDGKFLVFTLHDYGTFPIWHREADLYISHLQNGTTEKMNINSDETESYHTWSVNGRWLVFSSKRIDGRSARPHFVHIDADGKQGKEFVLPQKDPSLYNRMLESFNIPEFVNGKIMMTPKDFARASKQEALIAIPGKSPDAAPVRTVPAIKLKENERAIHE